MTARTTTAATWHQSPQARAILSRCKASEFTLQTVPASLWDENQYFGLTEAACRKIARLDVLRTDAIDAALGYTFASAQQPFDDARCRAYIAFAGEVPNVHLVLRDHFAAVGAELECAA